MSQAVNNAIATFKVLGSLTVSALSIAAFVLLRDDARGKTGLEHHDEAKGYAHFILIWAIALSSLPSFSVIWDRTLGKMSGMPIELDEKLPFVSMWIALAVGVIMLSARFAGGRADWRDDDAKMHFNAICVAAGFIATAGSFANFWGWLQENDAASLPVACGKNVPQFMLRGALTLTVFTSLVLVSVSLGDLRDDAAGSDKPKDAWDDGKSHALMAGFIAVLALCLVFVNSLWDFLMTMWEEPGGRVIRLEAFFKLILSLGIWPVFLADLVYYGISTVMEASSINTTLLYIFWGGSSDNVPQDRKTRAKYANVSAVFLLALATNSLFSAGFAGRFVAKWKGEHYSDSGSGNSTDSGSGETLLFDDSNSSGWINGTGSSDGPWTDYGTFMLVAALLSLAASVAQIAVSRLKDSLTAVSTEELQA